MNAGPRVIDAAVRFLRSNPDVLAYARRAAPDTGMSVDEILADAVKRLRDASDSEAIAKKEVVA